MADESLQNLAIMQGMLGGIERNEMYGAHKRAYDMQAQKMADEKAATDATPGLFRQMQEDPQFMDKYRPQTATDLAAFANARKQYLDTQQGQIQSFQNLTARAQQSYQAFAAPAREALAAYEKGDTQRAMDLMQTASNGFPDPMRITGYDPSTGEAIISKPNPKTGGFDEVGRKSPEELMQMTKTMLSGGRVRSDGVEINPEFAKAYGLTAFAASEENHKLAQDFAGGKIKAILQGPDGKVIHAAPQYDFQSHDYNYFVPGAGFMSKQQLAQAGYGFTTEQSVQQAETGRHNRVAEGLAAEGHAIQRDGQAIQQQNADLNRQLREDANKDKQVTMLDKMGDDAAREEDAIYKRYSQVPTDPNNLAASLLAQKQDGLQNLQKAAAAGDQQAAADLARAKKLRTVGERVGDTRMQEIEKRFPALGMKEGMGQQSVQPSQSERGFAAPQQQGQAQAPQQSPSAFPAGAVRSADGQVYVPTKDRVAGAVQKQVNGVVGWYVPFAK